MPLRATTRPILPTAIPAPRRLSARWARRRLFALFAKETEKVHYELSIDEHPGYLHAKAVGEHNRENVLRFLVDAGRACVERNCQTLLLELGLKGPALHAGILFQMILDRAPEGRKCGRIAYV